MRRYVNMYNICLFTDQHINYIHAFSFDYNTTPLPPQNKLGDTPLHNAAWKGHADLVGLLLEKGRS